MNKKTKEFVKKFCEMSQIFEQSENPLSCDYYDIPDFQKPKIKKQRPRLFIIWTFLPFQQISMI